jgi:hypothetical protein
MVDGLRKSKLDPRHGVMRSERRFVDGLKECTLLVLKRLEPLDERVPDAGVNRTAIVAVAALPEAEPRPLAGEEVRQSTPQGAEARRHVAIEFGWC